MIERNVTNGLAFWFVITIFATYMEKIFSDSVRVRFISVLFVVIALGVFKPFNFDLCRMEGVEHLLALFLLGFGVCECVDLFLTYVTHKPQSFDLGVDYIIRRNLWFQIINTPFEALMICLYRYFVVDGNGRENMLSFENYFATLFIIAFCSFCVGMFWRFKFRSRFYATELEEVRMLNEHLMRQHAVAEQLESMDDSHVTRADAPKIETDVVLKGTTSDTVKLNISDLLYLEAVGNYVKVCHLCDGTVRYDMLRTTSKQMEDDLRSYPMIVRCHRAFLVNLNNVERIKSSAGAMQLIIRNCSEGISVSRSNVSQVKEAIERLASS